MKCLSLFSKFIGMLRVQVFYSEFLLHLLQIFNAYSTQVKQIQSLIVSNGYLLKTDQWINTLLYNNLIKAYVNLSQPDTSLRLFIHMLRHQAPPNDHTFPSLLKASASIKETYFIAPLVCSYHAQCVRRGLLNNPYVRTSFISLYSQFGDVIGAHKMFNDISKPCVQSCNAMLAGFGKSGDVGLVISMFQNMPLRDVYSWTTVINSCMKNGYLREAISFFRKMMVDEFVICGLSKPSEATFVSILSTCANLDEGCASCLGKQIHGYMCRNEEFANVLIETALIAFYGKTGCLDYANKVFNAMKLKKVCAWNAIIFSLASNGRESQALHMFQLMKASRCSPNEVTFVGILSACARAKLVEVGLKLFQSIEQDYGITPTMEHYGCLVDLFGRAGLLKEAYDVIKRMPFEADTTVWGALLSACRVHGAVGLGNEIGKQLLELHPQKCGRYVMLSSISAGAEKWDHSAKWRKAMVDAGIQKLPAFSMANST